MNLPSEFIIKCNFNPKKHPIKIFLQSEIPSKINLIKKFLKDIYIKLSNGKINFNNTPEGKTQDSYNEKLILYIPGIIGKKLMDIQTIFSLHSTYFELKFNNGVIWVIVKD